MITGTEIIDSADGSENVSETTALVLPARILCLNFDSCPASYLFRDKVPPRAARTLFCHSR